MKNKRRIVLAAFLLVAILVVGVGFATFVKDLMISGTATFNPASYVIGNKGDAVKFSQKEGDTTIVPPAGEIGPVTTTAQVTGDNTATMSVIVNGITDRTEPYVSTATFTIVYDSTDTTLDPVYLYPVIESTNTAFDVEVDMVTGTSLAVGEEIEITVTVTFDPTDNAAIISGNSPVTESISIRIGVEDAPKA